MIHGIDCSSHQSSIAWNYAAEGRIAFGIPKASEGTGYTDLFFDRNWQRTRDAGVCRGAYHFMRADLGTSPIDEADWFLSVVEKGGVGPGDFVALDVEDFPDRPQPDDLHDWVLDWLEYVEAQFGKPPFIYSRANYLQSHNLTDPRLAKYPLWLASWIGAEPVIFPRAPAPWSHVTIWQWTDHRTVPGVLGLVDGDVFAGTVEQLRAYEVPAAQEESDLSRAEQLVIKQKLQRVIDMAEATKALALELNRLLALPDYPELEE